MECAVFHTLRDLVAIFYKQVRGLHLVFVTLRVCKQASRVVNSCSHAGRLWKHDAGFSGTLEPLRESRCLASPLNYVVAYGLKIGQFLSQGRYLTTEELDACRIHNPLTEAGPTIHIITGKQFLPGHKNKRRDWPFNAFTPELQN